MRSVPILIIGGGAAGMMAAASAIEQGGRVMVIEKMAMLGKKILATGNGRCNFTNLKQQPEFYHVTGSDDVWKLLRRFDEKRTISFFKEAGVYPEETAMYIQCQCRLFHLEIVLGESLIKLRYTSRRK